MGQSAAKHSFENEGSTTRSKDRTSKWMEMGSNRILVEDIVSSIWKHIAVLNKNGIRLTTLCEDNVMEELFVAPLHYGSN